MENLLTVDNIVFILVAVVVLLLCIKVIRIYNKLVVVTRNVEMTWSNIGVILKQRHDELPKLIDTCKEYMGYEQETLQQVMDARAKVQQAVDQGDVAALNTHERTLKRGLGGLFALAENYPDLKATNSFTQLQTRISSLENELSDKRELYNDSVNTNNIMVRSFPDMFVAKLLNFGEKSLLEFDESEKADVDVQSLFSH